MADTQSRLSAGKLIGVSFAVTLGVWLLFSWPLPRYAGAGIPAAAHREAADVQHLFPGHRPTYLLVGRGHGSRQNSAFIIFTNSIPAMIVSAFEPYAYYILLPDLRGGGGTMRRGFRLNLASYFLWLTYLLTWLLVRRWTRSEWWPLWRRWDRFYVSLDQSFGGSPAGCHDLISPSCLGLTGYREDRVGAEFWLERSARLRGDSHVFFSAHWACQPGASWYLCRADFQWRQGELSAFRYSAAHRPVRHCGVPVPVLMKALSRGN